MNHPKQKSCQIQQVIHRHRNKSRYRQSLELAYRLGLWGLVMVKSPHIQLQDAIHFEVKQS